MTSPAVHYNPDHFPPTSFIWEDLVPLLGPAHDGLSRFDGLLQAIPNAEVLLAPLAMREARDSSSIEGTQTTVTEVMKFEAEGRIDDESTPIRAEQREVLNYRLALDAASKALPDYGLSQWLVRSAHEALMQGVRGREKNPGQYRSQSVFIGPRGAEIEDAEFIPCPAEQVAAAMDEWEQYTLGEAADTLVQLAVSHVQFEAIHPFADGNGRIGRLLLPLFLVHKNLLSTPSFYLSGYLDQHRDEYIDRLRSVSRDGDWTGWCAFFLRAVIAQSVVNQRHAQAILDLYQEKKDWIQHNSKSRYAIAVLDAIFDQPVFRVSALAERLSIERRTLTRIVQALVAQGMLVQLVPNLGSRGGIYAYLDLLNIAESGPD